MSEAIDVAVIGAGVVGLAIARALAVTGREVIVVEKNSAIGAETSSRSSEVIHAGIYYTPGSLKAQLCVRGRDALYRYCAEKGISHRRCGKVLVAVAKHQTADLELLRMTAATNGVSDLQWLDRQALAALEPAVVGHAGLLSPSTGIVDTHALMLALQGDLEKAGGHVALRSALRDARSAGDSVRLSIDDGSDVTEFDAKQVVNAGGLHSAAVAEKFAGFPGTNIPAVHYAKGNYFIYQGRGPFNHLVYPLPEPGGLGVHVTLDLAGRTRFGPDVEWSDDVDYDLDESRAEAFYAAIRRYWPDLPDGSLSPGYVGVRPKLSGPGEPPADFDIQMSTDAGGVRVVHLFGIESPGLTASLALAALVRARLDG